MTARPTEKEILLNWEDHALSDKFRHHRKRKRTHEEQAQVRTGKDKGKS